jgi:16S rRNA C1402 N4-methylase RsmH
MKIIASMEGNRWLAEIHSRELRELNRDFIPNVGVEYPIDQAAKTLQALRTLRRDRLERIDRCMNDLLKSLGEINEAYDSLMLLNNLTEHQE